MNLRWLVPGVQLQDGTVEGRLEVSWEPREIPVAALFGMVVPADPDDAATRQKLLAAVPEVVTRLTADPLSHDAIAVGVEEYVTLLQFTVRPDATGTLRLGLYVYVRSVAVQQLVYNLVTVDEVYRAVAAALSVTPGTITVHLHCLYYRDGDVDARRV